MSECEKKKNKRKEIKGRKSCAKNEKENTKKGRRGKVKREGKGRKGRKGRTGRGESRGGGQTEGRREEQERGRGHRHFERWEGGKACLGGC